MNLGASAKETDRSALLLWAVKLWACLCAATILLFAASTSHAQTTTTYTNSTDSATNEISGANACSVAAAFQRNFVVPDNFTVTDVNVGVLMAHNTRSDVALFLRSPAGDFVTMKALTGGGANNFNVLLDDQATANVSTHTAADTATAGTSVPPYQRTFQPANSLNATYSGQNSQGTWTLFICDFQDNGVNGTFFQADLFLTTQPTADLSLSKSVSNATPANGTNITYTLQLSSAAGSTTASGVTVRDVLPAGVTFVSSSGYGSYNSATGIWSVPSIAAGQTRTRTIVATINATSGATIVNSAEVQSSPLIDPDSTPGNNSTNEDDDDTASFTVSGTRVAGTPPNFNAVCPLANQIVFDWNGKSWPVGSLNNNYAITGLGTVNYNVSTDVAFVAGSPTLNNTNTGGFGTTQQSLFLNMNNNNQSDSSTTVVTLPTAVPGLQFHLFDVDFGTGTNGWADKVTVTGSYNGATVMPVLTNNLANYVVGNTVIGDGSSSGDQVNGNVIVTFMSPVDTVTFVYGNHTTAPANPGNQFMNIYDFRYCQPQTTLSVTKVSQVISDPVSGTTNPKAIPGATMQYCILISNSGSANAESVTATDTIPGNVTYTAGTMQSGANCGSAATAEDDDATGADESDPFGASISGTNLTMTAASLGPAENYALTFRVTVD